MKILIADDEPDVVEVLEMTFKMHWPDAAIFTASNGEEALTTFFEHQPGLVLLDIAMPELSGLEVCRRIRRVSNVPIIMLTVKDEEIDKVRGLEAGADDYVTKPFGHLELIARARALLRRTGLTACNDDAGSFDNGYLSVDFSSCEVRVSGRRVLLTPTEFQLLALLVRNPGQLLSHSLLLSRVWGPDCTEDRDYLKAYVKRLRQKLEPDPRNPTYILTERGFGYRFVPEGDSADR
ncbi:MAG TPA: response regulator transcription factor [Chloroflexota bacterium]|nr:response regulator transcription factor [Chloroflexota bacterium]